MSDIKYDSSGNSNSSLHVGVDNLNLLLLLNFLCFFMYGKY